MSKIEDGGPAFPHSRLGSDCDGMSLRDYFAAKAMQGVLMNPGGLDMHDPEIAEAAYEMADSMLRAREAQS